MNPQSMPASAATGGMGRYLGRMSLLLLALYCLPLGLVRRADFDQRSMTPYSLPLNYAFKMAGADADVVLFGDSTLLHGVDPSQMSRELGVKVVSLPNTGSTLRVLDDLSLQRYLRQNKPPRLIVFYFAPWDLDYRHTPLPIGTYEGREVLAHQGTAAEIWNYAKSHPADSLEFPFQFYLSNEPLWGLLRRSYLAAGEEAERTNGHFTNPAHTVLSANCAFPKAATDLARLDTAKALGAKYATAETRILYFIAPVPGCRGAEAVVGRSYGALPAEPPKELPPAMFSGETLYLHPLASSVPAVTEDLVSAVRSAIAPR